MNYEEHIKQSEEMKECFSETAIELKIQRLKKEDFVVTVSSKDLIAHLKDKILELVLAAHVEDEEFTPNKNHLRLIYKGKVLLDLKSIEFYKIQNDDTIQLCPIRVTVRDEPSVHQVNYPLGGRGTNIDIQEDGDNLHGLPRGIDDFSLVSFSLGRWPEPGDGRRVVRFPRISSHEPNPQDSQEAMLNVRRSRGNLRRSPMGDRTSPEVFTGNLQILKLTLEETVDRIGTTNMDNREELLPHLDTLIRQARNIQDDLRMEQQMLPLSGGLLEILLLGRSSAPWAGGAGEEKENPPVVAMAPRRRVVARLGSPPVARGHGSLNFQISTSASVMNTRVNGGVESAGPNTTSTRETASSRQRRNTRSRNIFSNFMNRFNRH